MDSFSSSMQIDAKFSKKIATSQYLWKSCKQIFDSWEMKSCLENCVEALCKASSSGSKTSQFSLVCVAPTLGVESAEKNNGTSNFQIYVQKKWDFPSLKVIISAWICLEQIHEYKAPSFYIQGDKNM